jgi:signal transduction histidine kinase
MENEQKPGNDMAPHFDDALAPPTVAVPPFRATRAATSTLSDMPLSLSPDSERSELDHRERQIDAIRRISQALFAHRTVPDMVREILHVAIDVLRAEVGSVQLYDAASGSLVFRYVNDPAADRLLNYAVPVTQGIAGEVFRSGNADLTQCAHDRAEFNDEIDRLTGFHTQSMLTAPLKRFEGEPIGVVQVLNARETFDLYDLEVLEALCAQAATSIETARLGEEARQAEIVNLIGDISHDIKNMLTPIHMGAWTLQTLINEAMRDLTYLQECCPDGEPWGERIEKAIALLRSEAGWILETTIETSDRLQARTREIANAVKGEISPPVLERGDLNETVRHVAVAFKAVASKTGVDIFLDLDGGLPSSLFDPRQLYNALYNVVSNALEETPAGGRVTIRTRMPHQQETTLLLQVEDNGRGMPERIRSRLFSNETISTKPGGTGLGSRIVAKVVRSHRGTIEVDSEENRGTTISIRLPLQPTLA